MALQSIELDENDELVFEFPEFELVLHSTGNYILCDEGYFAISGLGSFKPFDDQFVVINEEEDKFFISSEDFEKIKEIYLQHG